MTAPRLILLAGTAALAWGCAEPRVDVTPPGPGNPAIAIYLVAHEGHTGIVVPRAKIPAGSWPEIRDFPGADYLEVGWGDRDYYMGRDQGVWGTLKAGLWPTASVLHVVGVRGSVARYFRMSEVVELTLSREGFDRLVHYISDAYERVGGAPAASLGPGLYGESRFYPARESFHLFRTCNVWTARALRAGGLPVHDSITSDGLMAQAREIGKVVNTPPDAEKAVHGAANWRRAMGVVATIPRRPYLSYSSSWLPMLSRAKSTSMHPLFYVLVLVSVIAIAGCHGTPKRPPPDQVMAGSTLTVVTPFTIPAGQTGIYFQDNSLQGAADLGSGFPYCHFWLPGSAAKPRTVGAQAFTVSSIELDEEATRRGDGFASITRLNLQGGKQAGKPRVSCRLPGEAGTRRFVTPAEIRGALGAYFDLKVAQ